MFGLKPRHRRSSRWPALRARHLAAHPSCESCGTTKNLEAHHIVPVHIDPSRELDPANLIALCESDRRCHLVFGHFGNWKWADADVRELAAAYLRAFTGA